LGKKYLNSLDLGSGILSTLDPGSEKNIPSGNVKLNCFLCLTAQRFNCRNVGRFTVPLSCQSMRLTNSSRNVQWFREDRERERGWERKERYFLMKSRVKRLQSNKKPHKKCTERRKQKTWSCLAIL
jgi:hypothetical protein